MRLINLVCVLMMMASIDRTLQSPQIFKKMSKRIPRDSFRKMQPSEASLRHEVVIAVKQKNLDTLEAMVLERSRPGSDKYRNWMTHKEVGELVKNPEGTAAVEKWLESNNIDLTWKSVHGEYLKASAPIEVWEKLLDTQFYQFEDTSSKRTAAVTLHRADEYSIPAQLQEHVFTIFNTVQTPPELTHAWVMPADTAASSDIVAEGSTQGTTPSLRGSRRPPITTTLTSKQLLASDVNVDFLNRLYHIPSNQGSPRQRQSVFQTNDERFSPSDLSAFQTIYGLPSQSAIDLKNRASANCNSNGPCTEGNLDLQYIMGVAQGTTTVFWHMEASDPFVDYITEITSSDNPPLVNSISWGSIEQANGADTLRSFNTEAIKLAAIGGTIVVSTGDDGVAARASLCTTSSSSGNTQWTGPPWSGRGYFPSFPASSPYVTAVGATQGPENGNPEIACQSQLGGVITTGGGFSTFYPTPDWQQDAVDAYFANLQPGEIPVEGYNRNGRGFPDISFIGVNYQVIIAGSVRSIFGTSASAPLFGAMISLINAIRAGENKTAVGYLNPTLYGYGKNNTLGPGGTNFNPYTDVTSGHNRCTASGNPSSAICCDSGFAATRGWDPVTGWGSALFPDLAQMAAVEVNYTIPSADDNSNGSGGWLTTAILIVIIIAAVIIACSLISCFCSLLCSPCAPKRRPPPPPQAGLRL